MNKDSFEKLAQAKIAKLASEQNLPSDNKTENTSAETLQKKNSKKS